MEIKRIQPRHCGVRISDAEFLRKLNTGGWIVSGGHMIIDTPSQDLSVKRAWFIGNTLKIKTPEHSLRVPRDKVVFRTPWVIEIRYICALALRLTNPPPREGNGSA